MASEFYSGMKGPEAINKLNSLWDLSLGADGFNTSAYQSSINAATSATAAANSATAASTSATNAANSAASATSALSSINTIFDTFDDRFLGAKSIDPTVDNDGNALVVGTIYYNTTINKVKFYNGTSWDTPELTATNAANSASSSATAASTSATNAANSASAANTSATNAANSATAASTSATNAANSATAASTSATNASASASTAASNATIAINNAGAASTSATNAANSASAANTSATNAAASATSAANSASAASTTLASVNTVYDNFDDRYLGNKASNPTTDNDGQTLLVGALYWNSTSNEMRVWSGSAWVAAYLPSTTYVTGPASATNNAVVAFDGTTGKTVKNTGVSIPVTSTGNIVTTGDTGTVSNVMLVNSTITVNGSAVALGGSVTVQPSSAELTAIAALSGTTGLIKKTAAGAYSLDTTAYASTSVSYSDPTWITSLSVAKLSGTVSVGSGGTGATTLTGILKGNGTSAITAATAGVDYAAASHQHAASDITSGTIATARLASGTANSTTFLRGDQTWATVPSGGISAGKAIALSSVFN